MKNEPTLGEIKRALHGLSRGTRGSSGGGAELLREAHEMLRQLARRSGIDPDKAVEGSRAAAQARRDRMAVASARASDLTRS